MIENMPYFSCTYLDISKLAPIKERLQQTVDKDGLITYGHIRLTIAVLIVRTGYIRAGKVSRLASNVATLSHSNSQV